MSVHKEEPAPTDTYVLWGEGDRAALERIIKNPQSLEQTTLAAEIERLRAALAFYADHHNYDYGDYEDSISVVQADDGDTARKALG